MRGWSVKIMVAVRISDVHRTYGQTKALDGVSLDIAQGEIFAVIGPNGAGKTTLVRAITGTTRVDGAVEVFGQSPRKINRERIGLLPQEFAPADRLTPRELLQYYGGLYTVSRPVDAVLDEVGLLEKADTYYENLSGGQKRRTCVGIAIINDPDLLILDEPTTGIDPTGRRNLWTLLRDLAKSGTTVVLTTHYMEEAEQLADRVALLAQGSLIASGSPSELISAHGGSNRVEIDTNTPEDVCAVVEAAGFDILSTAPISIACGPRDIGTIADLLDREEITFDTLLWRQPDLEDVYLKLTGTETERLKTSGYQGTPKAMVDSQ